MKDQDFDFILSKLQILKKSDYDLKDKVIFLHRIIVFFFDELVSSEGLHLGSLFTRIAYSGNKFRIARHILYHLHGFRKMMHGVLPDSEEELDQKFQEGFFAFYATVSHIARRPIPEELVATINRLLIIPKSEEFVDFYRTSEIWVTDIDRESKLLKGNTIQTPHDQVVVKYDIPDRNEIFTPNIESISQNNRLPITMYLHDISIDAEGMLHPEIIVIEPSFLVDVTAVAGSFSSRIPETRYSLIQKFLPAPQSKYILIGNIANYFLDRLIASPEITFEDVKTDLFALSPLTFALYDDQLVKELLEKALGHFNNLKYSVQKDLFDKGIKRENIYLEPAFFSPKFGIQGRLDLLHIDNESKLASIVELKSGRAFRPNTYGLSSSHYIQTLLYDLMVESILPKNFRFNNYILYSGESEHQLRQAVSIKAPQKEAIWVRNSLVLEWYRLMDLDLATPYVLEELIPKEFANLNGFNKQNVEHFSGVYAAMDGILKKYFNVFTQFITKERFLSKLGSQDGSGRLNGLASLWINTLDEKKENFNILNDLEITSNKSEEDVPIMVLRKSANTAALSNFRVGDIGIFYPAHASTDAITRSQVFKCTILDMNLETVTIRLRSQQYNYELFRRIIFWNIEHDSLDSGFTAMYRSLFEFAESTPDRHALWLGMTPPKVPKREPIDVNLIQNVLTNEQFDLLKEMIVAEDYYLLWGPPGTGKTSIIIRYLVKYLFHKTDEDILLLAYTNKAVDEICEALSHEEDAISDFIRIGSRYAVDDRYADNLLDVKIKKVQRRTELRELLHSTRIFVGTVSSIVGKPELFYMKKFDRVIIDEASQLIEPLLMGMLTRFAKVNMIGDHRQLPAVVLQSYKETEVVDGELNSLGLVNRADSLFERLYKRAMEKGWTWAYGQLSQQARMHPRIMSFPSKHFYDDKLDHLNVNGMVESKNVYVKYEGALEEVLATQRCIYIPSEIDTTGVNIKTNDNEADLTIQIVKALIDINMKNDMDSQDVNIGIITPFRAQISNIRGRLQSAQIEIDDIMIDTVERYQGGARNTIIISFSLNHLSQFRSLISTSAEGIDRKLNVALTRARNQIILIGNKDILTKNDTYRALIESYYELAL